VLALKLFAFVHFCIRYKFRVVEILSCMVTHMLHGDDVSEP